MQRAQHVFHVRPLHLLRLGDENLFLARRGVGFLVTQKLLVELFARTQAGVDNFHRGLQGIGIQLNHPLRQFADFDGLAHVQHKQLAAAGNRRGLQHKARRLRDGHEVADDVRVRQRNRAARANLPLEQRHDAAVRPQHIAEADSGELRRAALLLHGFDDDFRHALRGAHDVGGIDRLVGGDHHEPLCAVFLGALGDVICAENVVAHRLFGAVLHQRDVLMRRRVDDDFRFELVEHLIQRRFIANRTDAQDDRVLDNLAVLVFQLGEQVIHVVFADVVQHQLFGDERHHLPAHLRPD